LTALDAVPMWLAIWCPQVVAGLLLKLLYDLMQ
jgi:hypothetical protein